MPLEHKNWVKQEDQLGDARGPISASKWVEESFSGFA